MNWFYRAYDCTFSSELELPELTPVEPTPQVDVRVSLGAIEPVTRDEQDPNFHLFEEGSRCQIFFSVVARFEIEAGRAITIDPLPGVSEEAIRLPLLGAVLAILLEQRGLHVLHGGALRIGNYAAAVVGHKGQGKSTLNAALAARGHALFADDIVALEWRGAKAFVVPGFSQIKLTPESVRGVLGREPDSMSRVSDDVDKRVHRDAALSPVPLALERVYILDQMAEDAAGSDAVHVRELRAQDAIPQLLVYSYIMRFGSWLLRGERQKLHFARTARLATDVPCAVLERRMDLALVPQVARAVEADMARLTGGQNLLSHEAKAALAPMPTR